MYKHFNLVIVFITICVTGLSQKRELYIRRFNGGLCSSSIELSTDWTYTSEQGCENSSYVSSGTWIQKRDTIKFAPINTKDFKISKIVPSKTANSKMLSVKVFDQTGKNITDKIILGQNVQGNGYYVMGLDSTKTKRTDFLRNGGVIVIMSLRRLNNGSFEVPIDSFNNFEITLNIPNNLIYNIKSNWVNTGDFELLKRKDALLSVETYPADENGKPYKMEYKKQLQ